MENDVWGLCPLLITALGVDGERCSAIERCFTPFGDFYCVRVVVLFLILVFDVIVSVS